MTGHSITRETIEVEVGYTRLEAPTLEVVVVLLAVPAGFTAPFGD